MRNKKAIITGLAVTFLAGAGVAASVGVPAVMAGSHIAPGPMSVPAGWPAAKAAGLRAEDQLRREAASRPLVPPGAVPPGTVRQQSGLARNGSDAGQADQSGLEAGIIPLTSGGPFGPGQFIGTNLWNGPVRGRWEVVQAGGVPDQGALGAASPTRAAVFVYTRSSDPASSAAPDVLGAIVPANGPAGEFTITKVSGHVLTLVLTSGRGKTYHFDTSTLRFLHSDH